MKLFLVGDLMIDEYHFCRAKGISPEAPILHFERVYSLSQLGGAGNVAINLSSLQKHIAPDKEVIFLGPLPKGREEDVPPLSCFTKSFRDNQPFCIKNRILSGPISQQIIRYDDDFLYLKSGDAKFCAHIRQEGKAKVGIVSDYNHGAITNNVLRTIKQACEIILIDPKGSSWQKYKNFADIITPNISEVHDLIPGNYSSNDAALHLLERTKSFAVVLKKGEKGCSSFTKDGNTEHFEPYRTGRPLIDVTGAGDTFIATLGICLIQGVAFTKAVELSNKMAGLSVTKQGCFVPEEKDIEEVFGRREG